MTEKRFIVIDDGLDFMVRDTFTGDNLIDADGVADVLNDYEKENEQLKEDNMLLIDDSEQYRKLSIQFDNRNKELIRENAQLKKENQRLEKQKNVLINYMDNWCPKRFYDGIIKRMEEVE